MDLPSSRGPVSRALISALASGLRPLPERLDVALPTVGLPGDDPEGCATAGDPANGETSNPILDEDLQLVLFICYQLHYGGFVGVDDRWEWEPSLLALRASAERRFEAALHQLVGRPAQVTPAAVPTALAELVAADTGPSVGDWLRRHGDLDHFREFVIHRSIYHLREADPHTWGIPRVTGPTKAALVEIQMDEYGNGRLDRMHSELFRDTMRWFGLPTRYGSQLDAVPAVTLASNNLMSYLGLHRRWRGALLGHLAAFEMTSSVPNRRYGDALRRLGGSPSATRFYDEHVTADAVHEQIAAVDLCGSFAAAEPDRAADLLFGAACGLALDRAFAVHVLDRWRHGASSLRTPAEAAPDLPAVVALAS